MLKNKSFLIVFGLLICLTGGFGVFMYKLEANQEQVYQECLSEHIDVSKDIARRECDWILD